MSKWLAVVVSENRGFIVFLILMSVFRSSFADWNTVPTGSMKPTIIEGDRIVINKLAYDLKLPFTDISIARLGEPERGDIIIFNSKVSDKRLVKRVIGVPGDRISMRNNVLTVNNVTLRYALNEHKVHQQSNDLSEDLLGIEHSVRVNKIPGRASSFKQTLVPEGMFLALGDNRDNSVDSRYIGFIPRGEIIGRSQHVAMSFDYDDYYLLRKDRFAKKL